MANRAAASLAPEAPAKGWQSRASQSPAARRTAATVVLSMGSTPASRALATSQPQVASAVEGRVQPGDRFLLCSDGLDKVVSDAAIAPVIGLLGSAEAIHHPIRMALDRGAPDNVSVAALAVAVSDPPSR
ncbi:MAG TPA: hypothetical protein VFC56_11065 [Stellaceae bacterium]|nr:hypothetical protein [Stellaceae bacterium]